MVTTKPRIDMAWGNFLFQRLWTTGVIFCRNRGDSMAEERVYYIHCAFIQNVASEKQKNCRHKLKAMSNATTFLLMCVLFCGAPFLSETSDSKTQGYIHDLLSDMSIQQRHQIRSRHTTYRQCYLKTLSNRYNLSPSNYIINDKERFVYFEVSNY